MEIEQVDVIIVGAGPGGSTAAALLVQKGWQVLLLDRAEFPRDKTCGDGLTPRAVAVLQRLGLLDRLQTSGYQEIQGARVRSPRGEELDVRFEHYGPLLGLPKLGLVVPRYELDDHLRRHAIACGAHFRAGVHVTGPIYQGGQVVGVEGKQHSQSFAAHAPLTILATGADMGLLRSFGVLSRMPPGASAVRAYYQNVTGLSDEFEFYFEPGIRPGYAWVFPLTGGRANVGVGYFARTDTRPMPNVKQMMLDFVAGNPHFRQAELQGPIKGFPLRTDFPSHSPIGPGFLILGESLGLVNPTTGEGIDFAMESAELAAQAADLALSQQDTSRRGLHTYSRLLYRRYGRLFPGLRTIKRLAMSPQAISVLVHKAQAKPRLAYMLASVTMAAAPPWSAFTPRVWWDILT